MSADIRAVAPNVEYGDAFLRMLDDFDGLDPDNGEYYADARIDRTLQIMVRRYWIKVR